MDTYCYEFGKTLSKILNLASAIIINKGICKNILFFKNSLGIIYQTGDFIGPYEEISHPKERSFHLNSI